MTRENAATLFIDGRWQPSSEHRQFDVVDPATDTPFGSASDGGRTDAHAAIDAAARAFDSWAGETAYVRSAALLRAHRLMTERADDLAALMTREQGKPLRAARNEVNYGADFLIWFAEEAKRVYGSMIPSPRADHRLSVLRQPVGVVAAITPWNYPISMITRKVAPAVAAGCTIVLKPAEQTPLCAVAMFKIFEEAGLPAGVVNLVTSNHPEEVGDVLLESRTVRKLTFTGSTSVGRTLGAQAAKTMKRVSMELGGHAPFLVFEDADIEHAAKGAALVKFLNTGQACICPNRIFVQAGVYDQFVDVFSARVKAMKVGNGATPGTSIGPLIDTDAMDKMSRQVDDAVAKGARVLAGGHRVDVDGAGGKNFYAPTVLVDVTEDMEIYREETFGPIAAIIAFDDEAEAIAKANDTDYGLASYVYTDDLRRAVRVTEKLRFGIVGVNDINPTAAAAPFGGIKDSGLGREGGAQALDEYLDVKLVGMSL
ncbi:MAG: NAD-dependent succinate-semialdehyde dehydrogenase [Rhodococcus sp.]|jgi:succinate-semialdehyde dehydrogenase/glutarate-semialdehyde dehydrogenase|uniref:NAD-dependent succinate-semialdehyde dehydrogenase n=1 Tax=Rhodococcus TaxID=1827 RepID=UPI001C4DE4A9|nr:NAD-dependent succinate-semialdehyde dehydrogenase [Rhodococcus qingshengii]MCW0191436.1 NAD-dependent succinate-semialdehyde dehydrogenase [Rhodococcus sp. (in: high G+C Gram-positive bacteria)]